MKFSDLLDHVNDFDSQFVLVDTHIMPFIKSASGQDDVFFVETELDIGVSRGHFKRYRDPTGVYSEPKWITEVRYADELNYCWKRFVCAKELMHAFDSEEEKANTPEKFRTLLGELEIASPDQSPMILSENRCYWRAMAALAPPRLLAKVDGPYNAGLIGDYDIAAELRIPEFYVPHIMHPSFDGIVRILREG